MSTVERAFSVVGGAISVGLLSLEDICSVPPDQWETIRVVDIMTPTDELSTLSADEGADEALQWLQQKDVRQPPVLEDGRLTGLLRRRDIIGWLQLQGAE